MTNLYNHARPMIRYDTKGTFAPFHLSAKLFDYLSFKKLQLVQKGFKDYGINLNISMKVDEIKIIKEYKGYFGSDSKIKINYVEEIPYLF
tara:strand:- start:349 stop:618 length:270 start_codon:yes stop_codon:yes gene_type:complete